MDGWRPSSITTALVLWPHEQRAICLTSAGLQAEDLSHCLHVPMTMKVPARSKTKQLF